VPLLKARVRSGGAAIFGEGRDQPRSISSSVLPLVSEVNFQTNRTVRTDMAAYVQKAPVTVTARASDKENNVSPRHAIHRLIVAMDIARPRMRVAQHGFAPAPAAPWPLGRSKPGPESINLGVDKTS
jgi:hypothetical protein